MEADGSGGLQILNALFNDGTLFANTGKVVVTGAVSGDGKGTINKGTIEFGSAADTDVTFTADAGLLRLDDSSSFAGTVAGLSTDGGNAIDLADISFAGLNQKSFTENGAGTEGQLALGAGSSSASITLLGNYISAFNPAPGNPGFVLADDGTSRHGTLVKYDLSAPAHG
jgi:hypothetical protein